MAAWNRGDQALALIYLVHMGEPALRPALCKRRKRLVERLERLRKANFDPAEPRDDHGRWTTGGDEGDAYYQEATAHEDPLHAEKRKFVEAHLKDAAETAARLHVPVENILGISALESGWGDGPFAKDGGNNYFGQHYPSPMANGYKIAKDSGDKVSTYASYADSLKEFEALHGANVYGVSDPDTFARNLQNTGKLGVTKKGYKLPNYVPNTSSTIRHLRPIIAEQSRDL